jgi:hypothetical protein
MTLEEASKRATPGPYRYDDNTPGIVSDGAELFQGGGPLVVVNCLGACQGDYPQLDLSLLAHCYNHFDEVVEALTDIVRWHEEHDKACPLFGAHDALARAQEVDV